MPLKIAAKVDKADEDYFRTIIEPLLDDPLVEFIGEIDDHAKTSFLGNALALLFPIDWPEPFGLVMIEAMAAGTPVIAWRAGSVPEVVDDGITGIIVESMDEAVRAVDRARVMSRDAVAGSSRRASRQRKWRGVCRNLRAASRGRIKVLHRFRWQDARRRGRPMPSASFRRKRRRQTAGNGYQAGIGMHAGAAPAESRTPADDRSRNLWSEYEIEAQTSLVDRPLRNLKHGDAFAVLDSFGDIGTVGGYAGGPVLSRYPLSLPLRAQDRRQAAAAARLRRARGQGGAGGRSDQSRPAARRARQAAARYDLPGADKFLWKAVCYERIKVKNYGAVRRAIRIDVLFAADFRDMFEVRGTRRDQRGRDSARVLAPDRTELGYLRRSTGSSAARSSSEPRAAAARRAPGDLGNRARTHASMPRSSLRSPSRRASLTPVSNFFIAYRDAHRVRRASTGQARIVLELQRGVRRGRLARHRRCLHADHANRSRPLSLSPAFPGSAPSSGATASSPPCSCCGWIRIDREGVLRTLAATQATDFDPKSDAQPGKILHEMRHGEMANLGEVPFRRYYGSVDATPLFLMLAGQYFERTGDRETIEAIWPNIEAALAWIDMFGDRDGDGFVEYHRETESGLVNQGWKDSYDAIFHADGSMAAGPIALCEVQGYVFAAKCAVAGIARAPRPRRARAKLRARSREPARCNSRQRSGARRSAPTRWRSTATKRPCRVRASNAGHALFTGIASPERARRVAASLMSPEGFSGWGIRTVAHGEARYNPMSYHNGSVWPHDNALIAASASPAMA